MKCILGIKKGMTQVYDEHGVCHPVTILEAKPATVSAVRSLEKDGYTSIQIRSGEQKSTRVSKAFSAEHGSAKYVVEFRPYTHDINSVKDIEVGTRLTVDNFSVGDKVMVSANSKGKGFQGVVKRHGFSGGPKTHGNKHHERAPGSIGATGPARVFKGTKMAGRMGNERVTTKNLLVVQIIPEENLLLVRGAVPGYNGSLIEVRSC